MTVNDYLNVMLANDAVREQILKYLSKLQRILSEVTRHVVQQISDFDLDVIEVSNGCASRISTREFFVFRKEDFDGTSSRAFVPYDCLPPPDPGCFACRRNRQFIPRSGATRQGAQQVVSVPCGLSNARKSENWFSLGPRTLGRLLDPPFFAVSCRLTRSFLSRLGDNSQPV